MLTATRIDVNSMVMKMDEALQKARKSCDSSYGEIQKWLKSCIDNHEIYQLDLDKEIGSKNSKLEPIKEVNENENDHMSPAKLTPTQTYKPAIESRILSPSNASAATGNVMPAPKTPSRVLSPPRPISRVVSGNQSSSPPSRVIPSSVRDVPTRLATNNARDGPLTRAKPPAAKQSPVSAKSATPAPSATPSATPASSAAPASSSNRKDLTDKYRGYTTDMLISECYRRGLTPVGSPTDIIENLVNDDVMKSNRTVSSSSFGGLMQLKSEDNERLNRLKQEEEEKKNRLKGSSKVHSPNVSPSIANLMSSYQGLSSSQPSSQPSSRIHPPSNFRQLNASPQSRPMQSPASKIPSPSSKLQIPSSKVPPIPSRIQTTTSKPPLSQVPVMPSSPPTRTYSPPGSASKKAVTRSGSPAVAPSSAPVVPVPAPSSPQQQSRNVAPKQMAPPPQPVEEEEEKWYEGKLLDDYIRKQDYTIADAIFAPIDTCNLMDIFPNDRHISKIRGSSGNWENEEVRRRTRQSLAKIEPDDE